MILKFNMLPKFLSIKNILRSASRSLFLNPFGVVSSFSVFIPEVRYSLHPMFGPRHSTLGSNTLDTRSVALRSDASIMGRIRMATRTMRFSKFLVVFPMIASAAIFLMRDLFQVIRINTSGIAAKMVEAKKRITRTYEVFIGSVVRQSRLPIDGEASVAAGVDEGDPFPTIATNFHLIKEPLKVLFVHWRYFNINLAQVVGSIVSDLNV